MEKTVIVTKKGELQSREWIKPSGEKIDIKSIELTLTDGIDTFVAEATDNYAEKIAKHDFGMNAVSARCELSVREVKTQSGGTFLSNRIRLLKITGV